MNSNSINFDYKVVYSDPSKLLGQAEKALPTLNTQQFLECEDQALFLLEL